MSLILFCAFVNQATAQFDHYLDYHCPVVDSAQLDYYDVSGGVSSEDIYVKVYLNIVRKDNGTGGYPAERLPFIKEILDDAFNPHGIYFVYECEELYLDDDELFQSGVRMGFPYNFCEWNNISHHADGIDIYLIHNHFSDGSNHTHFGHAEGIPGTWFVANYTSPTNEYRIENQYLVHQMGHLFGMFHTGHGAQLNSMYYDSYPDPPPYSERFDCSKMSYVVADPHECPEHDDNGANCGDYIEDTPRSHWALERCHISIECPSPPDPVNYSHYNINKRGCADDPTGHPPFRDIEGELYDDIPFKNFMSLSSVFCLNYFTTGQVEVMRNFLLTHPVLENVVMSETEVAEFCPCEEDEAWVINENTILDEVHTSPGDIIIEYGSRLTVTGKLQMLPDKRIYVERGAVLEVDGGLITKRCDDMWGGIQIQGNASKVQPEFPYTSLAADDAGAVVMINYATVEWAKNAIQTRDDRISWPQFAEYYGGVMHIDRSNLKNNQNAIGFMHYDFLNKSHFDQMEIVVEASSGIINPTGMTIWKCRGLEVTRSNFRNLFVGIGGINFDAHIYNDNYFLNCRTGIEVFGTHPMAARVKVGTYNSSIDKNYFLDNMISIRGEAIDIGEGLTIVNNEISKSGNYSYSEVNNRAISILGRSVFMVDYNFLADQNIGLFISNTGSRGNKAECNTISMSGVSNYVRVGIEVHNFNERFEFKYNTFELEDPCSPDVRVVGVGGQTGQVRFDIGEAGDPARNCFSHEDNTQIKTLGPTVPFDYWVPTIPQVCHRAFDNLSDMGSNNYYVEESDPLNFFICTEEPGPLFDDPILAYNQVVDSLINYFNWQYGTTMDTSIGAIQLLDLKDRLHRIITDSLWGEQDFTGLETFLSPDTSSLGRRNLFGLYLTEGRYNEAWPILNNLVLSTADDSVFHATQTINLEFLADTLGYELSPTKAAELEGLVDKNLPSSSYARGLLYRLTDKPPTIFDLVFCGYGGSREIQSEDNEKSEKLEVNVSPNPASHYLEVSWNIESIALLGAEIFNSSGAVVGSYDLKSNTPPSILVDQLHEGMYVIRLKFSDGSTHTHKFIRQ